MDNKKKVFKKMRVKRLLLLEELRFLVWCRDVRLFPKSVEFSSKGTSKSVRRATMRANLCLMRAVIKEKRAALAACEMNLYVAHVELAGLMDVIDWKNFDASTFIVAKFRAAKKRKTLLRKRWHLVHKNNAQPTVEQGASVKVVKCSNSSRRVDYTSEALKTLRTKGVELQESTKTRLAQLGLFRTNGKASPLTKPTIAARVPPPLGKALVNLSRVKLSYEQEALLKKGPKYALGPSKCDGALLAAHVEKAIVGIPEPQQTLLRANIVNVCRSTPFHYNKDWQVLTSIQKLDVVLLKADKAETVVLMDKDEFLCKVGEELRGGAYKELKKDPTLNFARKVLELTKKFTDSGLKTGRVTNPVAPRLFCQIKLHKVGRPLRLIVSSRSAPVSRLEKEVAKILRPYTKRNQSFIRNSEHVVSILTEIEPPNDEETLISLDIVQLFPNLPREETIEAVNRVLCEDDNVTNVKRMEVISAIRFCLEHSFFRFGGKFYQQIKGSPIGSSLSPILAEIYLTYHEMEAKKKIVEWPRLFIRYVDDHLVLIRKTKIDEVVHQLNAICVDIQFTVEHSVEGSIPFLDVCINTGRGCFETKVYRKPTTSGILINQSSFHHPSHKFSTWTTLVNRAYALSSDVIAKDYEIDYLKELASLNGFNQEIITRAAEKYVKKQQRKDSITLLPEKGFNVDNLVILPYLGKISSKIGELLKAASNKKVAFQPLNKMGDLIFNTKDPKTRTELSGVYKVPCKCGAVYIGQTARSFEKRLKEHKAAVMNFQPSVSAIARHFWSVGCDQGLMWDEGRVVIPDRNQGILKFREALEICLEQYNQRTVLMNDQEQLGHLTLWESLAGTWLCPTALRLSSVVAQPSRSAQHVGEPGSCLPTPDGFLRDGNITSSGSCLVKRRCLRVRKPTVVQQVRGASNGNAAVPPPKPRRGRPPAKGVDDVSDTYPKEKC